MNENQNSKGFNIVNFIGNICGAHIVIAALLYPRALLPNSADDPKKSVYEIFCLVSGTLLFLANIAGLVLLVTRPTWVDAAKIFFVFLCWSIIAVICITFNHLSDIQLLLSQFEEAAMQSADESAVILRSAIATVENWHSKLQITEEIELSAASILKKCAPLIMLVLRKEKSMLDIGIEAFKLVLSSTPLFKKLF